MDGGIVGKVDKFESLINLPLVLRILGIVVLGFTAWKFVHRFWPTTGLIVGAVLLVAAWFLAKQFATPGADALNNGFQKELAFLPVLLRVVGVFILAITIWKGVHGFMATAGVLVGGLMLLVGGMFNKIYK